MICDDLYGATDFLSFRLAIGRPDGNRAFRDRDAHSTFAEAYVDVRRQMIICVDDDAVFFSTRIIDGTRLK